MAEKLKQISVVGYACLAFAVMSFLLFLVWLSGQTFNEPISCLPAFLCLGLFLYAVFAAVPRLEDFFLIKRSRIDLAGPDTAFVILIVSTLAVNLVMLALAYGQTKKPGLAAALENFYKTSDIARYIAISEKWYENGSASIKDNILFFPLYPILMRIAGILIRNPLLTGLLLSNCFAVLSGMLMYQFVSLLMPERGVFTCLKFMFILPSSLFLFAPGIDSLFLFLSLACLYYSMTGEYRMVFISGVLVTLTQFQGVLLFIPGFIELTRTVRNKQLRQTIKKGEAQKAFSCLLAFPLGIFVYVLVNIGFNGNPIEFLAILREGMQSGYFTAATENLSQHFGQLFILKEYGNTIAGIRPYSISILLGFLLLCYGVKKVRPSLVVWAMAHFLLSLWSGGYSFSLLPLIISAASLARERKAYNRLLTASCFGLYVLYLI